ncbi:MAG: AmmeMemoRadiSam system radical SAM enzyme [Desulfobacterales bacterium]
MKTEAMLYDQKADKKVHCHLCSHHCLIPESEYGFCRVRQNIDGRLYTHVFGRPIARHVDPIEKKPLYHFLPGTWSYSVATAGCNFHCGFCQNWQISQIDEKNGSAFRMPAVQPAEIANAALENGCRSISYTYTEPTIFFEYAFEISKSAAEKGLSNVFVTNGYMTRRALDAAAPYLNAANVDIKAFRDSYYQNNCEARLKPVLDSVKYMKRLGIWVEVTTLIIPDENDSEAELDDLAGFIAETGVEIPWHISRFHPDYRFTDHSATPEETLIKAREIGTKNGLRYIYLGNIPADNDTYCHQCGEKVVHRTARQVLKKNLNQGLCGACGARIDGVWE